MGIFLTVLPLAVGGAAAVLTMDAMAQYSALPQPTVSPSGFLWHRIKTLSAARRRSAICCTFSCSVIP